MLTLPTKLLLNHDTEVNPEKTVGCRDSLGFSKFPLQLLQKFPDKMQAASAYRSLVLARQIESITPLNFTGTLREVFCEALLGTRFWLCNYHGYTPGTTDLEFKDTSQYPVGSGISMVCKQFNLKDWVEPFLFTWHLCYKNPSEVLIPWTLIEFVNDASRQLTKSHFISCGIVKPQTEFTRSSPFTGLPKFHRETFFPKLKFDSFSYVCCGEHLRFQIYNLTNSTRCTIESDEPKLFTEIDIREGFGMIQLPGNLRPGQQLKLLLYHQWVQLADEITLRVDHETIRPTESLRHSHDCQFSGEKCESVRDENLSSSVDKIQDLSRVAKNNLPIPISSPLIFVRSYRNVLNRNMLNNSTTTTTTTATSPDDEDVKMKFESDYMDKTLHSVLHIELYIRSKRRGEWKLTNISTGKIGKMRMCSISFTKLSAPISIFVESSNVAAVSLSVLEKSPSVNTVDKVSTHITSFACSTFSFYIIPEKLHAIALITVTVEFTPGKRLVLHQWEFTVAGHKFESSKRGMVQSESNKQSKRYYLFSENETQKILPSNYETDLDIADSLFLLKTRPISDSENNGQGTLQHDSVLPRIETDQHN